ncbi:unnamed protein product, partial [Arabidopsis halleri]
NAATWNVDKLQQLIQQDDIPKICRIRPRLLAAPDEPTWIYTRDGQYSAKSGIGWILQDGRDKHILKGSSSIAATESPLEAEAIALKEAILRLKMLGYNHVTFCGDSAQIYRYLDSSYNPRSNLPPAAIQGH